MILQKTHQLVFSVYHHRLFLLGIWLHLALVQKGKVNSIGKGKMKGIGFVQNDIYGPDSPTYGIVTFNQVLISESIIT